jgi:TrmH family RNA methyltransferase
MGDEILDDKLIDNKQGLNDFSWIEPIGIKHPDVVLIGQLISNKKVENDYLFAIEGLWAYEKILQGNLKVKTFIFCTDYIKNPHINEMVKELIGVSENTYTVSNKICQRMSGRDGAEGFFMLCEMPHYVLDDIKLEDKCLIVVLDGLEKPGNVGTIIRTVDGAGGNAVIHVNHRARLFNHEVIKSSMGSSFIIPIIGADISETAEWLIKNDFKIILTDLKADKYHYEADYSGRVAVVAGNERHGISDKWYSYNCERVIIPMLGGADSLNVGVATALVTYEASLQQRGMVKRG